MNDEEKLELKTAETAATAAIAAPSTNSTSFAWTRQEFSVVEKSMHRRLHKIAPTIVTVCLQYDFHVQEIKMYCRVQKSTFFVSDKERERVIYVGTVNPLLRTYTQSIANTKLIEDTFQHRLKTKVNTL